MRNVSTPNQERYQTDCGNVTIERLGRGSWRVLPRGGEELLVRSKAAAVSEAESMLSRARVNRIEFNVAGGRTIYLGRNGTSTIDPDAALDFPTREAAEEHARRMNGPRSPICARVRSFYDPKKLIRAGKGTL